MRRVQTSRRRVWIAPPARYEWASRPLTGDEARSVSGLRGGYLSVALPLLLRSTNERSAVHFESPSLLPVIESSVVMDRFDETGSLVQSDALFSYDPADPFAVTLVLKASPRDVRWTFARDLLIDGRFEPAGAGDVVVFPFLDPETGSATTVLELRSPGGRFMSQVSQQALQSFVRAMLDSVPLGAESELIDLDRLVELLVAPQE
jgi:hypothetical protein